MSMIPSGVRAVVFDAVGTLIHPDPPAAAVYAEIGRRFGTRLDVDEIRRRFFAAFQEEESKDRELGWRTSEAREEERWRAIVSTVLDDANDLDTCFHELFTHFARPSSWRCEPDIATALSHLARKGLTLAIASNFDGRLHGVVAGRPELERMSCVIVSSQVGWRKPAPEFFAAVCKQIWLGPREILYVGDDLQNDYVAAREAGLHAMLIASNANPWRALASDEWRG